MSHRSRCPLVVIVCLLALLALPAAGRAQTVPRDMELNPFNLDGGGRPGYTGPLTVFNVYWERLWDAYPGNLDRGAIDARMAALLGSGYDSRLQQYAVPGLVWGRGVTPPLNCHATARDFAQPMLNTFDVIRFVQCLERNAPGDGLDPAGGVPDTHAFPHPNATGTVIYNIVLPKDVQIQMGPGVGPVSCLGFGGFHFMTTSEASAAGPAGRPIYFTIIPSDCTGGTEAGAVALIGHEIVEAATDPLPLAHWIDVSSAGVDPGSVGAIWSIDRLLSNGEAGDLCEFATAGANFQSVPRVLGGLDVFVASYWSNADHACVIGDRRVVAAHFSVDAASLPPGVDPAGVRVVVDNGPPQLLPYTQAVLEGTSYSFVRADGSPLPATVFTPDERWGAVDCAGAVPFPAGNVDGNAETSIVCRYIHELRVVIGSTGLLSAQAAVTNGVEFLGLVGDASPLTVWLPPGTPLDLHAVTPIAGLGFVVYLFLGWNPAPPPTLTAPLTTTAQFKPFRIPRCMRDILCPMP